MYDESILRAVGSVAGIGGLSLGVFLILFRNMIQKIVLPGFSREQGYKLIRLFAFFAWTTALIGMILWAYVTIAVSTALLQLDDDPRIEELSSMLLRLKQFDEHSPEDAQAVIREASELLWRLCAEGEFHSTVHHDDPAHLLLLDAIRRVFCYNHRI